MPIDGSISTELSCSEIECRQLNERETMPRNKKQEVEQFVQIPKRQPEY